jgi:3-methyladenine DNA glycosylase AlkD
MKIDELIQLLESNRNPERAVGMSAYMRDQFPFLGMQKPVRADLCKPFMQATKKEGHVNWDVVDVLWSKPEREFQYVAMEYVVLLRDSLKYEDLGKIKSLIMCKSWWDTVDSFPKPVSHIVQTNPVARQTMIDWSQDADFWVRRSAIIHQLPLRDATDTDLLETTILNNLGQREFFINKAIGWSLREYSKTNAAWVRAFIDRHRTGLSPLSIREGSKYV